MLLTIFIVLISWIAIIGCIKAGAFKDWRKAWDYAWLKDEDTWY